MEFSHSHSYGLKNTDGKKKIIYVEDGIARIFSEEEWRVFTNTHNTDCSGDSRLIDMSDKYEDLKKLIIESTEDK